MSTNIGLKDSFSKNRRHPTQNEAENYYKTDVFFSILDYVLDGLSRRFSALRDICNIFDIMWFFKDLDESDLTPKVAQFQIRYHKHVSDEIQNEIFKRIFDVNF